MTDPREPLVTDDYGQTAVERVTQRAPSQRLTAGGRVIAFIEKHCVLSNGRWIGKPFILLPWQKQFINELFEIEPNPNYPHSSDRAWLRRFRWCLLGIPKKNGKCCAPSTLLTLANGSVKQAQHITTQDVVLSYDTSTGTLVPARVAAVEVQPPAPVYRVTTARGRVLETTGNHPYLVRGSKNAPSTDRTNRPAQKITDRWVDADALEAGDRLVIALNFLSDIETAISEREAWMVGAWVGDGSKDGKFTTADLETIERFSERFDATPCATGMHWYMRGSRAWLESHNLRDVTCHTKRVPETVLSGGRAAARGFLAGYLDTDGSINNPDSARQALVEWYSVSEDLLKDTQHLLAGIGINASLSVKMGRYSGEPHRSYRLTVRGRQQIIALASMLDLAVPEKSRRLRGWAERLRNERTNDNDTDTFTTDRVVAVDILAPEATIGVQIEGTHTHVTNGIVTHNTELIAAIALYLLLADGEPAPLVVCAAANEEQAGLVFNAAKTMCEQSPTLSQITECFDKEIHVRGLPNAKLQRVAAAAGSLDGTNIYAVVCDELHEWRAVKHEQTWTILTNGGVAREQPLVLQITTAGFDQESLCYRQYDYGKMVQSGEIDDRRYYFRWYEPPEADADWRDLNVIRSANPSYGHIMGDDFYLDQMGKKRESEFRRYFLNQWTATEDLWLPGGQFESLADTSGWDFDPQLPLYVGWDAATKYDSTALVMGQWRDDLLYVRSTVWEHPLGQLGQPIEGWTLPIEEVKQTLRELCARYNVVEIGFDPAFITWAAMELTDEGLPMVEFPQTNGRMVPATQALYELVVSRGALRHDGDPVLCRHMRSVKAKLAADGSGTRLVKLRRGRSVDAAIALVMVAGLSQHGDTASGSGIWITDPATGDLVRI